MRLCNAQGVERPNPQVINMDSLSEQDQALILAEEDKKVQIEAVPRRRASFQFRDHVYEGKIARIPEGYIGFSPVSTDLMLCFEQNKLFVEVEEPECQQKQSQRLHAKLLSWCGMRCTNAFRMGKRLASRLIGSLSYILSLGRMKKKSKNK